MARMSDHTDHNLYSELILVRQPDIMQVAVGSLVH